MAYQGIAAAKLNLSLDVLGKRADGYHELKSVMQTLSIGDVVEAELSLETKVTATDQALACDESNLAWRAYQLMHEEFRLDAGLTIRLEKHIPLGGGLAGGSSDAAQVLLAVNELFQLNLSQERLLALALKLGADVPFCLVGGTALATGTGGEIQPLDPCPELRLVLVNPGFVVPTADVYNRLDELSLMPTAYTDGVLQALAAGSPMSLRAAVGNGLEPAAFQLYRELAKLADELADLGLTPLLCGSGATLAGIACDKKQAAIAADALSGKYPFVHAVTTH